MGDGELDEEDGAEEVLVGGVGMSITACRRLEPARIGGTFSAKGKVTSSGGGPIDDIVCGGLFASFW